MKTTLKMSFPRAGAVLLVGALAAGLPACKKNEEAAKAAAPAASATNAAAPATPAPAPKPEPPKEEPPLEMKAQWPAGKKLVVHNETALELEVTNAATPQPVKTEDNSAYDLAFTVGKARENGGAEVELEVLGVRQDKKIGGKQAVSFDPKSDPKMDRTNPSAAMFRKFIGAKLKLLTAADGKIEKVEGLPLLVSKLTAGTLPAVQLMVRTMVTDNSIREWDTLHIALPDKPVKVGDVWETKRDVPYGMMKIPLITTNTFKGWEEREKVKLAKIEFAGGLPSREGAPAAPAAPALPIESAAFTGKALYNPALGLVVDNESTQQFTVNLLLAPGKTNTTKFKVKITGKLAEIVDAAGDGSAASAAPPMEKEKK